MLLAKECALRTGRVAQEVWLGNYLAQHDQKKSNTAVVQIICFCGLFKFLSYIDVAMCYPVSGVESKPGPEVINLFFLLNSAEHEIILLINVKMPTNICILAFISRVNELAVMN